MQKTLTRALLIVVVVLGLKIIYDYVIKPEGAVFGVGWTEVRSTEDRFGAFFPVAPSVDEDTFTWFHSDEEVDFRIYSSSVGEFTEYAVWVIRYPETAPVDDQDFLMNVAGQIVSIDRENRLLHVSEYPGAPNPTLDFYVGTAELSIAYRLIQSGHVMYLIAYSDLSINFREENFKRFADGFALME